MTDLPRGWGLAGWPFVDWIVTLALRCLRSTCFGCFSGLAKDEGRGRRAGDLWMDGFRLGGGDSESEAYPSVEDVS